MNDDLQSDEASATPRRRGVVCAGNEDVARLDQLISNDEFFWLDLRQANTAEINRVARQLSLHPLTVEDLEHFGQRAKTEEFEQYVYVVSYGAAPAADDDRMTEVHIVYSPEFLLTVAHDSSLELDALYNKSDDAKFTGHELLHSVLDALADSFAPLLDDLDAAIDNIEERVFGRELNRLEVEIHDLRRQISTVGRIIHRQTEAYTRLPELLRRMPDHDKKQAPYFRDVQDHLIRLSQAADSLSDRLQGVFSIYMAALDNRLNIVMKQFTVIAGIFLPLTVLVGFFGQNFEWMTDHIRGWQSFVWLGLVAPLVVVSVLLGVFKRRGLLNE